MLTRSEVQLFSKTVSVWWGRHVGLAPDSKMVLTSFTSISPWGLIVLGCPLHHIMSGNRAFQQVYVCRNPSMVTAVIANFTLILRCRYFVYIFTPPTGSSIYIAKARGYSGVDPAVVIGRAIGKALVKNKSGLLKIKRFVFFKVFFVFLLNFHQL